MDAIAEDCLEESATPTDIAPPTGIGSVVGDVTSSVQNQGQSSFGGSGTSGGSGGMLSRRPVTPVDEGKQRRTGAYMVHPTTTQSQQMLTALLDITGNSNTSSITSNTNSSLYPHHQHHHHHHHLPSTTAVAATTTANNQVLLGMLKAPVVHTQTMTSRPLPTNPPAAMNFAHTTTTMAAAITPPPPQPHHNHHSDYNNHHILTNGHTNKDLLIMSSLNGPAVPPASTTNTTTVTSQEASVLLQMQQISNHISTVLSNFGIHFTPHNNGFRVDHLGVQFHIHVANNIQLQYIAGDTSEYQSLCSELCSRLVPNAYS